MNTMTAGTKVTTSTGNKGVVMAMSQDERGTFAYVAFRFGERRRFYDVNGVFTCDPLLSTSTDARGRITHYPSITLTID